MKKIESAAKRRETRKQGLLTKLLIETKHFIDEGMNIPVVHQHDGLHDDREGVERDEEKGQDVCDRPDKQFLLAKWWANLEGPLLGLAVGVTLVLWLAHLPFWASSNIGNPLGHHWTFRLKSLAQFEVFVGPMLSLIFGPALSARFGPMLEPQIGPTSDS